MSELTECPTCHVYVAEGDDCGCPKEKEKKRKEKETPTITSAEQSAIANIFANL